eukprot:sb/3471518/
MIGTLNTKRSSLNSNCTGNLYVAGFARYNDTDDRRIQLQYYLSQAPLGTGELYREDQQIMFDSPFSISAILGLQSNKSDGQRDPRKEQESRSYKVAYNDHPVGHGIKGIESGSIVIKKKSTPAPPASRSSSSSYSSRKQNEEKKTKRVYQLVNMEALHCKIVKVRVDRIRIGQVCCSAFQTT